MVVNACSGLSTNVKLEASRLSVLLGELHSIEMEAGHVVTEDEAVAFSKARKLADLLIDAADDVDAAPAINRR